MSHSASVIVQVIDLCKQDGRGSLETALLLAVIGHRYQKDRGGAAYILHPLHVMQAVSHLGETYQIVAILHDVCEDCHLVTPRVLRECGFSDTVVRAVELLMRKENVSLHDYVDNLTQLDYADPAVQIAVAVKIEDSTHNSDGSRLSHVSEKDVARCKKYQRAATRLKAYANRSTGS